MIFAMAIGSCGEGEERYLLYIPFSVSPGRDISNINSDKKYKNGKYEIGFEKLNNFYALTFGPFTTEEDAKQYFPKLKSALLWVSIKYKVGLSSPAELCPVTLFDAPKQVPTNGIVKGIADYAGWNTTEGSYNADDCVIRPDHKRLIRFEGGQGTVIAGLSLENLVECVNEGISFPNPEKIQNDKKLQLAIELYSSYFFEKSKEAKFIKLVTVLEALTPNYNIADPVDSIIIDVKKKIKAHRNEYNSDSKEWGNINHLLSRVAQLKQKSIGASIRKYVSNLIDKNPDLGDKTDITNKLKELYNHRSKLLHEGASDINAIKEGLQFLTLFIPKLLKLLYKIEAA